MKSSLQEETKQKDRPIVEDVFPTLLDETKKQIEVTRQFRGTLYTEECIRIAFDARLKRGEIEYRKNSSGHPTAFLEKNGQLLRPQGCLVARMMFIGSGADFDEVFAKSYIKKVLEELDELADEKKYPIKILFSIQTGANHWNVGEVIISEKEDVLHITMQRYDPYGKIEPFSEQHQEAFENFFKEHFKGNNVVFTKVEEREITRVQTGNLCGGYVANMMYNIASGRTGDEITEVGVFYGDNQRKSDDEFRREDLALVYQYNSGELDKFLPREVKDRKEQFTKKTPLVKMEMTNKLKAACEKLAMLDTDQLTLIINIKLLQKEQGHGDYLNQLREYLGIKGTEGPQEKSPQAKIFFDDNNELLVEFDQIKLVIDKAKELKNSPQPKKKPGIIPVPTFDEGEVLEKINNIKTSTEANSNQKKLLKEVEKTILENHSKLKEALVNQGIVGKALESLNTSQILKTNISVKKSDDSEDQKTKPSKTISEAQATYIGTVQLAKSDGEKIDIARLVEGDADKNKPTLEHNIFRTMLAQERAELVVQKTYDKLKNKNITADDINLFVSIMKKVALEKLKNQDAKNPAEGKNAGFSAWKSGIQNEIPSEKNAEEMMKKFKNISAQMQEEAKNLFDTVKGRHYKGDNKGARSFRLVLELADDFKLETTQEKAK